MLYRRCVLTCKAKRLKDERMKNPMKKRGLFLCVYQGHLVRLVINAVGRGESCLVAFLWLLV